MDNKDYIPPTINDGTDEISPAFSPVAVLALGVYVVLASVAVGAVAVAAEIGAAVQVGVAAYNS